VSDGVEVEAKHVIVATPAALTERIAFAPALPVDRASLLERMPAGSITKFVAIYDDAFWRADGLAGLTIGMSGPIEMTLDAGPPSGSPGVLAAFAFGPHARRLSEASIDVQRKVVTDFLASSLGPRAGAPKELVTQEWAREEWSHGCFMAHLAPGVM